MLQLCIFSLVLHKKYIYFANKKRKKKKELYHFLALYSSTGLGHGGDSGALLLPDPFVDFALSSACSDVTHAEWLRPACHCHLKPLLGPFVC